MNGKKLAVEYYLYTYRRILCLTEDPEQGQHNGRFAI